ncbi:MAG TPA: PIG-L deacetylase family protein [Anaerolineaceae bacterium]|nr:PIG-L deacetylase family protein [Anaerolineaceae bacterium]
MPKTVLALMPHPDDAEYYAGGLLAQFTQQGGRVIIVIATDGRYGSYQYSKEELVPIRVEEAHRAAEVLGADPPVFLGHPDFELDCLPAGALREEFIRQIRRTCPDVVVAEDPFGTLETHPDHRQVARAAAEAVEYAGLPLVYPEHAVEGLKPHFVAEKYFYAEHNPHANKIVDITATFERKMAALAEHKSQVVFLVEGILRQARQAGLDLSAIPGGIANDSLAALTWGQRFQAAHIGKQAGYQYGEAYRYERYHQLVEMLLNGEFPD